MAIVVVGGSAKDIGKTALVCAIISALRDLDWIAVKISAHDYEPKGSAQILEAKIREETEAGTETDTARYLAAGARRALLVTRSGAEIPLEEIQRDVGADRNMIFESNRIVDALVTDVCLALVVGPRAEWKPSFVRTLQKSDALVSFGAVETEPATPRPEIPRFALQSPDRLSLEMVDWLRSRLSRSQMRSK